MNFYYCTRRYEFLPFPIELLKVKLRRDPAKRLLAQELEKKKAEVAEIEEIHQFMNLALDD